MFPQKQVHSKLRSCELGDRYKIRLTEHAVHDLWGARTGSLPLGVYNGIFGSKNLESVPLAYRINLI